MRIRIGRTITHAPGLMALMLSLFLETLPILGLLLAAGSLSTAEHAVACSRDVRLRERANRGIRGARSALRLNENLESLDSTIRALVILLLTAAAVRGGQVLWPGLMHLLEISPRLAPYAGPIALAMLIAGIAIAVLILVELLPKRIARSRPEDIACQLSPPLAAILTVTTPLVGPLFKLGEMILGRLGIKPASGPLVTQEEIKDLISEGTKAGVFDAFEHEIFKRVFRFRERKARALMTPRDKIVWFDLADPPEEIRRKVGLSPHSRFPVCDETLDNLLGIVDVKQLLARTEPGGVFRIKGLLTMPAFIYEGTRGPQILDLLKNCASHFAVVLDEYGSVVGMLTLNDVVAAIVGDLPENTEDEEPRSTRRDDGSWELDGRFPLDEFRDIFDIDHLPDGDYRTIAGLVVTRLGHIPQASESFEFLGLHFEIVDVDTKRVNRVVVSQRSNGRSDSHSNGLKE